MATDERDSQIALIRRPLTTICSLFVVWKVLLISIICLSPGPGYDSSSIQLLFQSSVLSKFPLISTFLTAISSRLLRWDAIFFITTARDGYLYEHEWAFSWGTSRVIKFVAEYVFASSGLDPTHGSGHHHTSNDYAQYVLAGALVSILAHLGSVIVLYHLVLLIATGTRTRTEKTSAGRAPDIAPDSTSLSSDTRLAITAALLHIVSPAGVFLISPCSESLFSFLSFAGSILYFKGTTAGSSNPHSARKDMYLLLSALVWGASALIRSNGIFGGIGFVYCIATDVLYPLKSAIMSSSYSNIQWKHLIRKTLSLGISSLILLFSFGYPQWLAYEDFCNTRTSDPSTEIGNRPPWCESIIPAIYPYIQAKYWNVGFLRYWTLSNIPLFLLALPTLYLLIWTSARSIQTALPSPFPAQLQSRTWKIMQLMIPLALIQLVVAILAVTNFHVQIITRLASGYPVWYIFLALIIQQGGEATERKAEKKGQDEEREKEHMHFHVSPRLVVGWMVMYGLVQAALFASFLPPA